MTNGRVEKLVAHLGAAPSAHAAGVSPMATAASQVPVFGKVGVQSDDDVVIVSAKRTAIGRSRKGGFRETNPDNLLVAAFQGVLQDSKVDPALIEDVVVGNVQLSGAYSLPARTAMFRAGIPETASIRAVNRQCSSGIQAVASIAADIKAGFIDIGIGAGVESMSLGGNPGDPSSMPPMDLSGIFEDPKAAQCLTPMGITSENVAAKYGITREEQDSLAVASHAKALKAQAEGRFKSEIVPVKTIVTDADGNEKEIVVDQDEGPRKGTTMEGLAKLKPAFQKGGSTTAGNSSQTSDGAAAVLLMRRSKAKELGLKPKAVFRGFKVQGCEPSIMGIGPAVAIPALLNDTGVSKDQVDIYEINEAFASQATYCIKELGLPMAKINPNGGAISLGHPLGCTGARMVATLLPELNRQNKKLGIISMCIGTGMGAAGVFESEQ